MKNEQREKLIELLIDLDMLSCDKMRRCDIESHADYLLENNVVALPCKVGDTVYIKGTISNNIYEKIITQIQIYKDKIIYVDDSDNEYTIDDFNKTIFLTQEEAEALIRSK